MTTIECNTTAKSSTPIDGTVVSLGPTGKRLDYITWHQHHMYMARMLSEISTEQRPVGCYIVDQEHYQIVSGYSGEIISTDDKCTCAIVSALHKLKMKPHIGQGFIMYITSFPDCSSCLELIGEMKISKVWYWSFPDNSSRSEGQAFDVLQKKGIEYEKYTPTRTISIDFNE